MDAEGAKLCEVNELTPVEAVDPGVRLARITIGEPVVTVPGSMPLARVRVLAAAELLGITEAVRDMSASYAQTRIQFDKPIGTFQAVKHRCADMAIAAYATRAQTAQAAVYVEGGHPDADFHAAAAYVLAVRGAAVSTAVYRRGQVYASKGAYNLAIKDFDETLRINAKDVEALNNRCWTRTVIGDLQGALKDCNEALRLRPNFVDALDSRGLVNLKSGAAKNAIADFDAALRINPRVTSSLYGRGIAKQRNGSAQEGALDIANAKAMARTSFRNSQATEYASIFLS